MNIEATAKQIMSARHSDAFTQEACEQILRDNMGADTESAQSQQRSEGELIRKCDICFEDHETSECHAAQPLLVWPCVIVGGSSRMCERGTKACEVRHTQPQRSEFEAIAALIVSAMPPLSEINERSSDQPPSLAKATDDKQWSRGRERGRQQIMEGKRVIIDEGYGEFDHDLLDDVIDAHNAALAYYKDAWSLNDLGKQLAAESQRREQAEARATSAEMGHDLCGRMYKDVQDELDKAGAPIKATEGTTWSAHMRVRLLGEQLLSALAAIEKHNKLNWNSCDVIEVDLSALRKHDAELATPLVDLLAWLKRNEQNLQGANLLNTIDNRKWRDALAKIMK